MLTRAFTLIELLVVVGIVAVLLSIFLPTLARVRQQARTLTCQSNLRQIGQLAAVWAAGHSGFLPLDGTVEIPAVQGYGALPTALKDPTRQRYAYVLDDGSDFPSSRTPVLESVTPFLPAMLLEASRALSPEM